MTFRIFLVMGLALVLTSCATTEQESDVGEVTVEQRETMTSGPFDGEGGYQREGVEYEGPVPGSQQDLVINVGDRVFFGFDRYDLTAEAQETLELQAEWLKRYPNVTVTVEGHCDERGTREYNLALGERRANSVKEYLVALGISPDRVSTISYGKERPAVIGTGASVWAQNRRAVTAID